MIEVERHFSSPNIATKLKIDQKPFMQSYIQGEALCLGTKKINRKNGNGSNSHLQNLERTNEIDPFLKCIVIKDEKCIMYDNSKRNGL